jgi:hypothetical protein
MNELLARVIDGHGGLDRWDRYETVDATIVSGGGLFPFKGVPQDSSPRPMTVWLQEERSPLLPYRAPHQRTMFTPERIAIEKLDGRLVAERRAPKDSFAGHQMTTPWDAVHRAYSTAKPCGPTSPRPFFSRWRAWESRRLRLDGRARRRGACCAHISRVRLRRTPSSRIFSSVRI